ncbi:hypothetical protein CEXT_722661 [Caerostris extrusa]|uniref:Uncharacterized protein n=1 Tax=Caerostris extrusa TaxID=172846 RepID=A0AAV4VGC9_CAEEX|nr:hypothetical protein CEXT_722661 [Caerostris extrusa]
MINEAAGIMILLPGTKKWCFTRTQPQQMQSICSPAILKDLEGAGYQKLLQLLKNKRDRVAMGPRPLRCAGKQKDRCFS